MQTLKDFSDGSRRVQLLLSSTSSCDSLVRSTMLLLVGVFFFLSTVPDTVVTAATCPDDVLLAVRSCTPGNFSMGLFSDMRGVQLQCRSGTFEKSLACLTTLASRCHGDQEKRDLLGQYLGLQRLRDSWDRLCQRAPLLAEHFQCWEGTSQASSQCIRGEMANFSRRLHTSARTSANVSYTDKAMEFVEMSCSTSRGILQCFEPRLRTTCPSEVHHLLQDTYLAYQPPYCGLAQSSAPPGPASPSIAAILISVILLWLQHLIVNCC